MIAFLFTIVGTLKKSNKKEQIKILWYFIENNVINVAKKGVSG
jgi:hypothetical protein